MRSAAAMRFTSAGVTRFPRVLCLHLRRLVTLPPLAACTHTHASASTNALAHAPTRARAHTPFRKGFGRDAQCGLPAMRRCYAKVSESPPRARLGPARLHTHAMPAKRHRALAPFKGRPGHARFTIECAHALAHARAHTRAHTHGHTRTGKDRHTRTDTHTHTRTHTPVRTRAHPGARAYRNVSAAQDTRPRGIRRGPGSRRPHGR
jgi:hypothetical protein